MSHIRQAISPLRSGIAIAAFAAITAITSAPAEASDDGKIVVSSEMQTRLKAEEQARKACKLEICGLFAGTSGTEGALSCDVTKTWVKELITKRILGDRIDWPYGNASCQTTVNLDRAAIADLRSTNGSTAKLDQHDFACALNSSDDAEEYTVNFSVAPEVTFANGQATEVALNWSNIDGSSAAATALWSVIQADSLFGLIDSIAVERVNAFVFESCAKDGVKIPKPSSE